MSNILQELEAEIKKATASVSQENVGVIRSVGDGVAKIEGLSGVMLNEMIEFPGGVMGLAMNLEEHEVGAVILGDDSKLKEGDTVKCSGRLLSVPVGRSLLGRVVNTLGEPIDGKGRKRITRWKKSPPASSPASPFPCPSRRASFPLTP